MMKLEDFIGREVQIYPGDTYSKWGVIEEVSKEGFLIRCTRANTSNSHSGDWEVGEYRFISHSKGITFKSNTKQ